MKKITFLILMALIVSTYGWQANAQTEIPQANATLTSGVDFVDGDIYTDSGNSTGNYSNNELSTITFAAAAGETITFSFTTFDVEASAFGSCFDLLSVSGDTNGLDGSYSGDGNDAGSGLSCTDGTDPAGDPILGPFTSTVGGSLSFTFDSDSSVAQSGWTAIIGVSIVVGDPPVIVCPSDIVANNAPGTCGAVANFAGVAFDTEDGNITGDIIATPASGSVFPVGDTTVTLSVTDSDGNTSTCEFTVTVIDNEAPVAVCQDLTLDLDPVTGTVSITGADVDNGSTDNCGIASMTLDISSFDCSMTGANTVTMTVTDNSGNSTTC
ncbi:MAG: HYR domain-containing protein, partial [Aequorivita sp.]|nr:HYR domain-containing protein [Aequorivita sp.]